MYIVERIQVCIYLKYKAELQWSWWKGPVHFSVLGWQVLATNAVTSSLLAYHVGKVAMQIPVTTLFRQKLMAWSHLLPWGQGSSHGGHSKTALLTSSFILPLATLLVSFLSLPSTDMLETLRYHVPLPANTNNIATPAIAPDTMKHSRRAVLHPLPLKGPT